MWEKLVKALLDSLLGAVVDAYTSWRRDRALRDLGYTEAQRDMAVEGLKAANAKARIDEAVRRLSDADLDRELRD